MNILNRFPLSAALLTVMLSVSFALHADELQDANQLFKQGQQTPALNKVNNYLANKPRDAQGRFLKGLILTEQGKIADAIKIFTELTQDYPELPEPYNNLAVLYASQSQYDKAKSSLEMAIRTHPSYATAHENLGDIYAKMASQAYDRALQLDSGNTTTQTKLAMIKDLFSDKPRSKAMVLRNPASPMPGRPFVDATPTAKPVTALPVAAPVAKPAPAPTPAATPVTLAKVSGKTTAEAPVVSEKARAVQQAVESWADAWSDQNVKKYLAHYAPDFDTPDGESRKAWAETRKERITRPKHIEVKVTNIAVDFTDSTHATVKFRQNYRASNFKANGGKTMLMVKSGNNWLIQEERTR
ncbi:nuclear transport factor 2 family protein [Gallionella capsiferriformans]|uniref:Tetratricopeptide TPR_1 repeat-containing protein n=1 Tax=Gallionella capsiferriformans (strain ES-2) TaxID=395494 RepID=D9SJE4_GALCS|nr:nuclear transport factor 2 family protein [Gallionella capsiferriformans]ADL56332.1 Tetratricopeptide TPR_1 repeat-containing protein [Gallionella capsiferriformans ES-2]